MLENLSDKFEGALRKLSGRGKISEAIYFSRTLRG
jgi:hypothetical protein